MKLPGRPLNPVLARELKERLRTRRTTVVVTVYLLVLAVILQIVYSALSAPSFEQFSGGLVATQSARMGRSLFETLLFFMLLLVCFIVPGLTADAITGERERQTLVPLQVSLLRPRAIVAGKILSALALVTLLVLATLPLLGVSFVLGGVSVGQMARGVAVVLASGLVVACVSLVCSSLARRTQSAMVLAYAVTLFLTLGTVLVYGAQAVLDNSPEPHRPSLAVLTLNPFFAAADATGNATFDGSVSSPLEPMRNLLDQIRRNDVVFDGGLEQGSGQGFAVARPVPPPVVPLEPSVTIPAEGAGEPVQEPEPEPAPTPDGPVRIAPMPNGPVRIGPAPGGFVSGAPAFPGDPAQAEAAGVPFWLWSALVLASLAGASFALATRRLRTPSGRAA